MINFDQRLTDKFLPEIKGILVYDPKEKLYQKIFGTYIVEIGGGKKFEGKLLVEFNEVVPKDGIYYGFKLSGISTANDIDELERLFAPFREHLEFELKKKACPADNIADNYYWVFWLRDDNADIETIVPEMELIRDKFNKLILCSNLKISKI